MLVYMIKKYFYLLLLLLLGGCSYISVEKDGAPTRDVNVSSVPDAIPRVEPRSKYGNPESYEVLGKRYYVMQDSTGYVERGIASWYGTKFHGRRTSSGETYDMYAMTAAHKTLPLPTYVKVKNLKNNRSIIVKVNDRGPFHENRIIDLSYAAAKKLDILANGTGLVEISAINPYTYAGEKPSVRKASYQTGNIGFYIQVGAFADRYNAEKLTEKLGILGDNLVKISQTVVSDTVLHRVRIGPLYDIDNADKIVSQLAQIGIHDHHIVIN